jgi:arginyl-tRNA synthetase
MTSLSSELSRIVGAAFEAEGLPADHGQVKLSDRPDLAQFQCNGALGAAKASKQNPRAIAEKIAARLRADSVFAKVEIAGPGFLNLDLSDAALAARVDAMAKGALGLPDSGAGKTLVIDFGGPNIAKPMAVHHLRSTIIGDCLQRLYRANGWKVISDVHLGDWGLQMGQLISEIEIDGRAPVYFDGNYTGPYPDESPVSMDELEILYPRASAACKADPARLEAARRATVDLQAGRPGYRALWRHFVTVTEVGLTREFGALGVHFDLWNGESSADPLIGPMLDDLKARGLAEPSEGALVVPVTEEGDKKAACFTAPPTWPRLSSGCATMTRT